MKPCETKFTYIHVANLTSWVIFCPNGDAPSFGGIALHILSLGSTRMCVAVGRRVLLPMLMGTRGWKLIVLNSIFRIFSHMTSSSHWKDNLCEFTFSALFYKPHERGCQQQITGSDKNEWNGWRHGGLATQNWFDKKFNDLPCTHGGVWGGKITVSMTIFQQFQRRCIDNERERKASMAS